MTRVIGHGAFGKLQILSSREINTILGYVFEGIDKNTGRKIALKRTQKVGNMVSREFEVLSLAKDCPNVVQMLDFFYTLDAKKRMIQNIVLEFCDMSLEDKLREVTS